MTGVSSSHFDAIASAYDESLPAHVVEHYLQKRLAFVHAHCPGGRALDVGCGTGTLAARLAASGYEVAGIDPSEGMLEVLRERTPAVEAVRAEGTAIPFPDDSFDVVLSVAVMHHIADAAEVRGTLAEMTRVTRPAGRILVWDHNPRNPYWRLLMARVPQDTGEERLIPEDELLDGLSRRRRTDAALDSARICSRLRAASRPPRCGRRGAGCGAHPPRPPALRPQRHPCRADRSSYTLTTTLSSPG